MALSEGWAKSALTWVCPKPRPLETEAAASLGLCPPVHMAIEGWRVGVGVCLSGLGMGLG